MLLSQVGSLPHLRFWMALTLIHFARPHWCRDPVTTNESLTFVWTAGAETNIQYDSCWHSLPKGVPRGNRWRVKLSRPIGRRLLERDNGTTLVVLQIKWDHYDIGSRINKSPI